MTKEEIKKAILNDEGCLDGIVDIIYQSKRNSGSGKLEERFLQDEVVGVFGAFYFGLYHDLKGHEPNNELLKLTPEVLAATVATWIPGAKWAAVDDNNVMHFFKDQPAALVGDKQWYGKVCREPLALYPYCIYCPVDDWEKAKWKLG